MQRAFCPSALIPPGFVVENASTVDAVTTIAVHSAFTFNSCPICGTDTRRIHSRYVRTIADLPLAGRSVRLIVTVRRFWWDAVRCARRLFAERFAVGTVAPWARRTGRLDGLAYHLGLALGGADAAAVLSSIY